MKHKINMIMKTKLFLISLLLSVAISLSAQQPPVAPDTITGLLRICPAVENATYVASPVSDATNYIWLLPEGTTGTSNTNEIILQFGQNFNGGYLKVCAQNAYGFGPNDSIYLTKGLLPSLIDNIWGYKDICAGSQNVIYTANKSLNATSYDWILPADYSGTSNTNKISINFGQNASSGSIKVYAINECGNSDTTSLSINIRTEISGVSSISGLSYCSQFGTVELSYVVDPLVKSYFWNVPYGLTAMNENNICRIIPNANSVVGQTYTITLTATDWCNNTFTATHNLTVTAFNKEAATIDKRFEKIINGTINDIELYKGKLYVCGQITRGNEEGNLFRWDGINWERILPYEGSETIMDMQIFDGKLYICGEIYDVNSIEDADYIARYDGTNWEALGNINYRPNGIVTKMNEDNGLLLINGQFNKIGNDTLNNHAIYNGVSFDNILDTNYFRVYNINLMTPTNNGTYLTYGMFDFSEEGEFYNPLNYSLNFAEVTSTYGFKLAEKDYEPLIDTIWYIGIEPFDYPVPGYDRIDIDTIMINIKDVHVIPFEVNKFFEYKGVYFAAGRFNWEYYNEHDVIKNKDLTNEGLISFTPHTNSLNERDFIVKYYGLKGTCKDVVIQNNKLICVGQFNQVISGEQFTTTPNILNVKNIAVLDLATETWSIIDNNPNFFQNANINKVASYNHQLFLGGANFESLANDGGSNCIVVRQEPKWAQIANLGIDGDVRKIVKVDNVQTLIMGNFIFPQDSTIQKIALFNDTVGFKKVIDKEIAEDFQNIYSAAYYNNSLYFSGYNNTLGEYVICKVISHDQINIIGTCEYGYAEEIKSFGNKLYVAGEFTNINSIANTAYIASWDGVNWSALGNGFNSTVHSLGYDSTYIYAGGNFSEVNGVAGFNYIAKWDGTNWSKVSQYSQLNNTVNSIYVLSNGNSTYEIFAGGDFGFKKLSNNYWTDYKSLPFGTLISSVDFNGNRPYLSGIIPYSGMYSTAVFRFNGRNWETPREYFEGTGTSILLNNGKLFMSGTFNKSNAGTVSENFAIYYLDTCSLPDMVSNITLSEHIGTGQTLCYGDTAFTLTASENINATSYEWDLPTGITAVYSQNGRVARCSIKFNFWGGTFKVYAKNDCGYSNPTSISLYPASQPEFYVYDSRYFNGDPNGDPNGIIKDSVCAGSVNNYFEVQSNYYTNYTWTLPTGFTGISDTTFMYYNVASSAISGNITIHGEDACGVSEFSYLITVNPVPDSLGLITGPVQVTIGQSNVVYKVQDGMTGLPYEWSFPNGFIGSSTADSIVLNVTDTAISGYIKVKQSNDCGYGPEAILQVTVTSNNNIIITASVSPANAGTVTGAGTYNYGDNATLTATANTGYTFVNWTENGNVVSTNASYTFTVNSDRTLVANFVISTYVSEFENKQKIIVYPNPVIDELIIECESYKAIQNFEILNSIGQVVFKGSFNEKTSVHLGNFATGVYLIKFENGKIFEFKKIIKK